jgi:hypothetical protein
MRRCPSCGVKYSDDMRFCSSDGALLVQSGKIRPATEANLVQQDVFLSHASANKAKYVEPLAAALAQRKVSFWLDSIEIGWGDSVPDRINEGLRGSRFALVCLSANYLGRSWAESEMGALLALQHRDGTKRVLPLILDSREIMLTRYPLIAQLAYREFDNGLATVVNDVVSIVRSPEAKKLEEDSLSIRIESVHTGYVSHLAVSPRQSVHWLQSKATAGLGLRSEVDAGGFQPFNVRWVLVDVRAETEWRSMSREKQRRAEVVVRGENKVYVCENDYDRVATLQLPHDTTFHLYAIEDERRPPPPACA